MDLSPSWPSYADRWSLSQKSADALRLSIGMSGLCGAIGSGRPPEARRVDGTSSSLMLEYGLLVLVALAMAVSIQVVGIILVVAMLVTPAATAQLLTDRFGRMLLAAVGFSVVESVVGLYLSFYGNWASARPSCWSRRPSSAWRWRSRPAVACWSVGQLGSASFWTAHTDSVRT